MRSILVWLVTVGMVVGMMARAVHAEDLHECASEAHQQIEASCFDYHPIELCQLGVSHACEEGKQDCQSSGHHHHHICCASTPLFTDLHSTISFVGVAGVRVNLTFERGVAPEEPVFELDTPPLI